MELVGVILYPFVFLALCFQTAPLLLKGTVFGFHITCCLTEGVGHIFLLFPQSLSFLTLAFLCFSCFLGTSRESHQRTDHGQDGSGKENVRVGICHGIEGCLGNGRKFGYNNTTTLGSGSEGNGCSMGFLLNGADA